MKKVCPFDISRLYIYLDRQYMCTAVDHDLKRRVVSQYDGISADSGSDPAISIDYLSLLRDKFYASIRKEANEMISYAAISSVDDIYDYGNIYDDKAHDACGGVSKAEQCDAAADGSAASVSIGAPDANISCDGNCDSKDAHAQSNCTAEGMTLDMFMNIIGRILGIRCFTYADKDKIYGFYDTFKAFDARLVEDTLHRLKGQYDDFNKNIIFYLNMLDNAVNSAGSNGANVASDNLSNIDKAKAGYIMLNKFFGLSGLPFGPNIRSYFEAGSFTVNKT